MKKVFRTILKICKVYLICDIICLAVIGSGEICEHIKNNPYKSVIKSDQEVWNIAIRKLKKSLFNR